jgi:predicted DNA binding CopG/RHH family protein
MGKERECPEQPEYVQITMGLADDYINVLKFNVQRQGKSFFSYINELIQKDREEGNTPTATNRPEDGFEFFNLVNDRYKKSKKKRVNFKITVENRSYIDDVVAACGVRVGDYLNHLVEIDTERTQQSR